MPIGFNQLMVDSPHRLRTASIQRGADLLQKIIVPGCGRHCGDESVHRGMLRLLSHFSFLPSLFIRREAGNLSAGGALFEQGDEVGHEGGFGGGTGFPA